ncbi:MAG: hypothetical protein OXG92_09955 [Chloroflexi bacterium]|nr:hypothetical protein [Chloroflexota bacterium]MCY3581176.1 hypothetical protein [Chloroflexota bacterium]MCY3716774.1 hypothetical protein [Chloroflexota bacterium]MDE2649141.1 hypothetical protein [Chloroflexota bacterium]MXV93868.1 hypothetical protein [Chloroflexota bacterium]
MVSNPVHKQIRSFVLVWVAVSVIMVLATFLAIYFTYNPSELRFEAANPLPLRSPSPQVESVLPILVLPSPSPQPTFTPTAFVPSPTPHYLEAEATAEPSPAVVPTMTPQPTSLPVADQSFQVGIHVQQAPESGDGIQTNYYSRVAAVLRLPWVKHLVDWSDTEAAPAEYDWAELDSVTSSAARYSLKLLLTIVAAPDWAREAGADLSHPGPPADPQTFANFAAEIVTRYPGRVHAIEVWHQQNLDRGWNSPQGLSANNYLALLQQTYQTIKVIDPGIIIISGAPTPTGVNDGITAFDDISYMLQLIDGGLLQWVDCVGAHHNGYNVSPDYRYNEIPADPSANFRGPFNRETEHPSFSFRSTLEGYANRIRAGGAETKICVTAFGWASAEDLGGAPQGFEFALDNSLAEQAAWTSRALSIMDEWGWVWLAFVWNFDYGPYADYATTNDNVLYSLIGPGETVRPAYHSLREWQSDYLARANS